jgi:hypothetical protein
VTRIERQAESDDEVRGNVRPELVALFERVMRSIKASPRTSRTEASLHYAEKHPTASSGSAKRAASCAAGRRACGTRPSRWRRCRSSGLGTVEPTDDPARRDEGLIAIE